MLKRHFSKARPILEAAEEAVIVCMLPLPRFVLKPRCGNKEHISNFSGGDFKEILKAAATSYKEVISAEGEKAGLALCTFNPVAAFRGGEQLAAKTNSAGLSVWGADDPVPLTAADYNDVAGFLEAQANLVKDSSNCGGRRRVNSVVPGLATGPEPVMVAEPGWISGTEQHARGRGSAITSGQGWVQGRGRGKRSYPL